MILPFLLQGQRGQRAINGFQSAIFFFFLYFVIYFPSSSSLLPFIPSASHATTLTRGFLPSIFHYSSNEAKPDPPRYKRLFIFHLALFLIAYLRVLKPANLIGKLKIWSKCTFRGRPITANKTLVKADSFEREMRVGVCVCDGGESWGGGGAFRSTLNSHFPHNTCARCLLLQLEALHSHFSPSTFIAAAAQDKQQ